MSPTARRSLATHLATAAACLGIAVSVATAGQHCAAAFLSVITATHLLAARRTVEEPHQ